MLKHMLMHPQCDLMIAIEVADIYLHIYCFTTENASLPLGRFSAPFSAILMIMFWTLCLTLPETGARVLIFTDNY